jgi:hypothetical protein
MSGGALHDEDGFFVSQLIEQFSGSRGASKLKRHLQVLSLLALLVQKYKYCS